MKVKKDKDDGYKITATIVTNEELERLDYKLENDLDNIVSQITNAVLKNRSLIVLQKVIKKQQKEIEQLDKKFQYAVPVDVINDLYISKDKIRKFIEEYLPDDEIMEICSVYDVNGILIREKLEKLLGE